MRSSQPLHASHNVFLSRRQELCNTLRLIYPNLICSLLNCHVFLKLHCIKEIITQHNCITEDMLRDTIRAITPHQTKVNPERDIISCRLGTPVPVRTKKYCVTQVMIAKETFARQTTRDERAKSLSVLSVNTPSWPVQFSSFRQYSDCLANKPDLCNLPLHFLTNMKLQNGCTSQCFFLWLYFSLWLCLSFHAFFTAFLFDDAMALTLQPSTLVDFSC